MDADKYLDSQYPYSQSYTDKGLRILARIAATNEFGRVQEYALGMPQSRNRQLTQKLVLVTVTENLYTEQYDHHIFKRLLSHAGVSEEDYLKYLKLWEPENPPYEWKKEKFKILF